MTSSVCSKKKEAAGLSAKAFSAKIPMTSSSVFYYITILRGVSSGLKRIWASASVLLLAFKMRQWDAGKKQGGTLQGGFLDFLRSWDPLTHFERFAFCFMLKP